MDNKQWVQNYLSSLLHEEHNFDIRDPFQEDECKWFRAAIENKIIEVRNCSPSCPLLKKRKKRIANHLLPKDEFIVAKGTYVKPRHLFEVTNDPKHPIYFGREYLPHIAAYTRLILDLRYNQDLSAFSFYRSFSKDLISKKAGGQYETDAEFYDRGGNLYLHVEVKKDPIETKTVVDGINRTGSLDSLQKKHVKELEYVLDLKPRYLWIVGPGSIDPSKYVYEVNVHGLDANFTKIEALPAAPY